MSSQAGHVARHFHPTGDGRIQCDVCPRDCTLHDGQRGLCYVRQRVGDALLLTAWGHPSGLCIDPIEKKPLHHFYPGTSVLSFGTVGCNLSCKFCQNWDMTRARELDARTEEVTPAAIADAAVSAGCRSVAFTYNDPTIFLEYAVDVADACHAAGLATVAVTAGYLHDAARRDLYAHIDAANVDLKAFDDDFYFRVTGARLEPVLDTLVYLVHEARVWTEVTTLLIPGHNDDDAQLRRLTAWVARELGPEVPLHFSAFHPSHRMLDVPPTPPATLRRARAIARDAGLRHVYTGNVRDVEGATTYCTGCGEALIERDGYRLLGYRLDARGACERCHTPLAGRWGSAPGHWGPRRMPLAFA